MKRRHSLLRRALLVCLSAALAMPHLGILAAAEARHSNGGEDRRIALTFDDGPHPRQTQKILNILAKYGVKATFFMIGVNVENYPEAARAVLAEGHEVGNHTFTHTSADRLDEAALLRELENCEDVLEEICEYRPHLFRPPRGILSPSQEQAVQTADYRVVRWSVDTEDWRSKDAKRIADTVLHEVTPGAVILMHDYIPQSKTPEALEILLPRLLALGYEPVTVSSLLGIG